MRLAAITMMLLLPLVPLAEGASDHRVDVPHTGPPTPVSVTVSAGDTVTWHSSGYAKIIESALGVVWCSYVDRDAPCTRVFDEAGTFPYVIKNYNWPTNSRYWEHAEVVVPGVGGPLAAITSHGDGDAVTDIVRFSGTFAADRGLVALDFKFGSDSWVPVAGSGTWSFAKDTVFVPLGDHKIQIRARDSIGAQALAAVTVRVANAEYHDLEIRSFVKRTVPVLDVSECYHGCIPESRLMERHFEAIIDHDGNERVSVEVAMQFLDGGVWKDFDRERRTIQAWGSITYEARWYNDARVGGYQLRVLVDALDEVVETDETNNVGYSYNLWHTQAAGQRSLDGAFVVVDSLL